MSTENGFHTLIAVWILAMYGMIAYGDHTSNVCRTELAKSTRTIEEIKELCK